MAKSTKSNTINVLWDQVDQDQLGNNVPQNASVINHSVTVSHQKKEQAQKLGSNQIFETQPSPAIQIQRNNSLKWSWPKMVIFGCKLRQ